MPIARRQSLVLLPAVVMPPVLMMPVTTGALCGITEVQRERRGFSRKVAALLQELCLRAGALTRHHAHRVVWVRNAVNGNVFPIQDDARLKLLAKEPRRKIETHGTHPLSQRPCSPCTTRNLLKFPESSVWGLQVFPESTSTEVVQARTIAAMPSWPSTDGVPTGIRTPVATVKGLCPRPLDDGDPEQCK